jgi:fusaric acid resistance family protein
MKALSVAAGIGVTIAVEYGFAQLVHPLWVSAPAGVGLSAGAAAALAAQHHGVTLVAMLLGGVIGMVSNVAMSDVTRREQAITLVGMPVVFMATLAISIELAPHRAVGLVGLSLVVGLGTYVRKFAPRFGPRVVMYGMLLFIGYFFGFLAGKELPISQLYWVAAILWLAVLVNLALRIVVFDRVAAGALPRSRRAFAARARGVIARAAAVLEHPESGVPAGSRRARRLARGLVALNESAITIDAQLADPRLGLLHGEAQALHDALFELEVHLDNLGRAIAALAGPDNELDPRLRARVRGWLVDLTAGDTADASAYERQGAGNETFGTVLATDNIVFATAAIVVGAGESLARWQRGELPAVETAGEVDFTVAYASPVMLIGGNLAGSTPASAAALAPDGLAARLHLDDAAVAAVRIAIAVGATCAVASAVNERRFYWAVIAVFMIYMGANTAGEQLNKAMQRVLGTCVGIVLGSLLAHAVGPSTWSIAVILTAMAFGVYFMPVSSGLLVIGFTVMVSMLYVDLGEFSNGLLLDRLELTAIGAAIAALAALVIFPLRTGRVVRQAALRYLDALLALVEGLSDAVRTASGGGRPAAASTSTAAARHVDDTLQQLLVTARPLTRGPFGRDGLEHSLQGFVLSAYFARTLAAGSGAVTALGETERAQLATALATEADLVRDLHDTIFRHQTGPDAQVAGSAGAPIIEAGRSLAGQGVLRSDPRQRFLRALFNLDGTLVGLGRQLADAPS